MFPSIKSNQQLLIYTSDQQAAAPITHHQSSDTLKQTLYSRKLEKPASEYPSTKIFEMASTMKVITPEEFAEKQTESNQKIKISINSSSVMRVKDSDRLRGLLQKIERSRAFKM